VSKLALHPDFDKAFEHRFTNALAAFHSDVGEMLGPDPVLVALELHGDLILARYNLLRRRSNVTDGQWKELNAFRQAYWAYGILQASYECELMFNVVRATLKGNTLEGAEKACAIKEATAQFRALESLDHPKRDAQRILTNLGLPSTLEAFVDNKCRIEIDLAKAKVMSETDFDQFFGKWHNDSFRAVIRALGPAET
jgi:hypothetical protein